jgi:serine/threonine-protein kinase
MANDSDPDSTAVGVAVLGKTYYTGQSLEPSDKKRHQLVDASTALPEELPRELNKYRILRSLGHGGMGSVYLAEDKVLKRLIALKVMAHLPGHMPELGSRLLREAQIAAQLKHPNIIALYDAVALSDGSIALITEFSEGRSLDHIIQSNPPIPIDDALRIGLQLASGLEAAHRQSIIHRDIKPSNILIEPDGTLKITDFGIAKLLKEKELGLSVITQTGSSMIGTPMYIAPEQLSGQGVDARSDIYSFGAVLYEVTTGKRYLQSESVHELMYKVVNDIPLAPQMINPSIPRELNDLILKCLQKNPTQRYSSAGELVQEISNLLEAMTRPKIGPK